MAPMGIDAFMRSHLVFTRSLLSPLNGPFIFVNSLFIFVNGLLSNARNHVVKSVH